MKAFPPSYKCTYRLSKFNRLHSTLLSRRRLHSPRLPCSPLKNSTHHGNILLDLQIHALLGCFDLKLVTIAFSSVSNNTRPPICFSWTNIDRLEVYLLHTKLRGSVSKFLMLPLTPLYGVLLTFSAAKGRDADASARQRKTGQPGTAQVIQRKNNAVEYLVEIGRSDLRTPLLSQGFATQHCLQ